MNHFDASHHLEQLSSEIVATRSERVIGPLMVIDQKQRRLSGPPRVS
jgi:hypothetical protein